MYVRQHLKTRLGLVWLLLATSCADLTSSAPLATDTTGDGDIAAGATDTAGSTDAAFATDTVASTDTAAATDAVAYTDVKTPDNGPDVPLPKPPADIAPAAGECEGKWFKVTGVADGDTFYIDGEEKGVRLVGIDTPEVLHNGVGVANCGGEAAKSQLAAWLQYGVQVCLAADIQQDTDTFRRQVRYVYVKLFGKDTLLNTKLLQLGHARVFTEYAKKLKLYSAFLEHEGYAKENAIGGWSACAGDCWWTGKKPCP